MQETPSFQSMAQFNRHFCKCFYQVTISGEFNQNVLIEASAVTLFIMCFFLTQVLTLPRDKGGVFIGEVIRPLQQW